MTAALEKTMTVREFLERDDFEENFWYELINGYIVKRRSPPTDHQRASSNLLFIFQKFNQDDALGEIFFGLTDVILDDYNLVQPDIHFTPKSKRHIIKEHGIEGAPDLLVEILSPGTYKIDRGDKFKVYQRLGVSEYWIVDPRSRIIEVHALKDGFYDLAFLGEEGGEVESKVLAGLKVLVNEVFG